MNSMGTSEPSALSCGGRTTWASTFFWVLGFSMESLVPVGKPSAKNNHGAVGADGVREAVNRDWLCRAR